MKPPIFVRSISDDERESLKMALRSKDAFALRRAQILLASSRGESPQRRIANNLGCTYSLSRCATPSTTSTSVV
jgi:hypothetical protein